MSAESDQEKQRQYHHYASLYAHRIIGDTPLFYEIAQHRQRLLGALDWGLAHEPQEALDFVWRVYRPLNQDFPIHEPPPLILKAYNTAKRTNNRLALARFARVQGDWSQMSSWTTARRWYEEALSLYQPDDNGQEQIDVLFGLRTAAVKLHDTDAVERYSEEIQSRAYDLRHGLCAHTLKMFAHEYQKQKDLSKAIHYLEALSLFEAENNLRPVETWRLLAQLTAQTNRLVEARHYYSHLMRAGLRWDQYYDLWGLGEVEYQLGNRKEGCHLCQQAILERTKDMEGPHWDPKATAFIQNEIETWQHRLDAMGCEAP